MSLSDEEETEFVRLIEKCESMGSALSEWERSFVKDQHDRYDQYKGRLNVSPKQWDRLRIICGEMSDPRRR